eukprot:7542559-Alexandrium_andersonii.AAC.1
MCIRDRWACAFLLVDSRWTANQIALHSTWDRAARNIGKHCGKHANTTANTQTRADPKGGPHPDCTVVSGRV